MMGRAVGHLEAPSAGLPPGACTFSVTVPVLISMCVFYPLWLTGNFNYMPESDIIREYKYEGQAITFVTKEREGKGRKNEH